MTLLGHSSTFLHPPLDPHSHHRWPCPGRSPDRRPSTPTWTIRPAPWPKAVAPPQWGKASRRGRRMTPLPPTKRESPVRSWRPILPCSARPCHRHHLSPPAHPRRLHIPHLRHHPMVLTRTLRPLASLFWSSLSARVAACVWKGGHAPVWLELPEAK